MDAATSSNKQTPEDESNENSDRPSKKSRSESTAQVDGSACSIGDDGIVDIAPVHGTTDASPEEVLCAICMSSDCEDRKLLENHNCPVCVAGAWNICDVCDDNLLSRSCPVCNSDYSPRILFVTKGLPTFPVSSEDMADTQFIKKICAIGKLVTGSNVTVWCPADNLMHFFMPQEFTDNNADFRSLSVVISMTADKIVDDQFLFTNKVWDELLKEMEEGATNSDEILTSKDTMKKIFTALNSKGSQLLTQLRPEEWSILVPTS